MYCVFNASAPEGQRGLEAVSGNPLGSPFEQQYGYFCDKRDRGNH